MVEAPVSNGETRRIRRRARLTQQEVADELRISRRVFIDYEHERRGLPFDLTPDDVLVAIQRIEERKHQQQT